MIRATTLEAYKLLHQGTLALAQAESNGIRIDVEYLDQAIIDIGKEIGNLEERLQETEVWDTWRKMFGRNKASLGSRIQLGKVFDKLGYERRIGKKGKKQNDEAAFETVKHPFVKDYFKCEKLKKAKGTYLEGIRSETVYSEAELIWILHPFFNLNTVRSFRSSASLPNFQNIPIRNEEIGKIIRTAFIPREGNVLIESDFKGIEVCLSGSTKIETIDGVQSLRRVVKRIQMGEDVYVYGYDHSKERISVGLAILGKKTRKNAEVWKVTLDNEREVIATPDHKFMRRDGTFVKLRDLLPGDSLMPFYKTYKKSWWGTVYTNIYLNNGKHMRAHNLIALDIDGIDISKENKVVHHWNGIGTDNSRQNTEVMSRRKHMRIHAVEGWNNNPSNKRKWKAQRSPKFRRMMKQLNCNRKEIWTEEDWQEFGNRISEGIKRKGGRAGKNNAMFGMVQSLETRKKISLAKKGVKTNRPSWNKGLSKSTDDRLMRLSIKLTGRPNPTKGKKRGPIKISLEERLARAERARNRIVKKSTRRKLSKLREAYWQNPGNKEKNSIRMKKYWAERRKEKTQLENHKVVSIEPCGREDVYNITVEGFHTYALNAGVVVKNCSICAYNHDPVLIEYVKDPSKDMHRDQSIECFLIDEDTDSKWWKQKGEGGGHNLRYCAKNMFVFPEFYGSYYVDCARNLWESIDTFKHATPNGMPMKEWLREKGIKKLGDCNPDKDPRPGTFEKHIQQVEKAFWGPKRFIHYANWKKKWYNDYLARGGFALLTGFYVQGVYRRNEVINIPNQGTAFHFLLWTLIQLQKWITKEKKRAKIVGQIHDCILGDVPLEEKDEYIAKVHEIVTEDLPRFWKWINVPLTIEIEIAKDNWFKKKGVEI